MSRHAPCARPPRRARGFTLIEILAVLAIVGLLVGIVAVSVGRHMSAGEVAACRARLEQIALLAESYADRMGEYPPSSLAALGIRDANRSNEGVEALVAALKSASYQGPRPEAGWMGNTDGDRADGLALHDGSSALLELLDPWDRPIVYLANAEYDAEALYRPGGDEPEWTWRAALDPLTGVPHGFDSYQLRSAGPDGVLGNGDDVASYPIGDDG